MTPSPRHAVAQPVEFSSDSLGGEHDSTHFDVRERVRELYRAHSAGLFHQLSRRTGCREVAKELTHETFVRVLRMPPAKLASMERPDLYLRRIAVNLLRDWGRSRARSERARDALDLSEGAIDQVAALESRDTLRRLEAAIATLKPKTREIFIAQRIHGRTYAEIAERTGLSIKGVEKQMSRAIAKIDRMLDRG